ncbi:hypothetical protein ABAC402_12550 [Asticcacaulis sp. AC402]|nr:hypothetical protein ABAC402_12550 [Asticcacaulis sp. AC402]
MASGLGSKEFLKLALRGVLSGVPLTALSMAAFAQDAAPEAAVAPAEKMANVNYVCHNRATVGTQSKMSDFYA